MAKGKSEKEKVTVVVPKESDEYGVGKLEIKPVQSGKKHMHPGLNKPKAPKFGGVA